MSFSLVLDDIEYTRTFTTSLALCMVFIFADTEYTPTLYGLVSRLLDSNVDAL